VADYFKFPVPNNPPDEGDFIIVGFNREWLAVILALVQTIRTPTAWDNPPDDITGQVDELAYLLETDLDP